MFGFALASGVTLSIGRLDLFVETPITSRAISPLAVAAAPQAPEPRQLGSSEVNAESLEKKLRDIAGDHIGDFGVIARDPKSNKSVSISENTQFEAASLAKLPVLIKLYKDVAEKKLDLDDKITIQSSDVQSYGSGILQNSPPGTEITLRRCAFLLINESDNTAWVMLERALGKPEIQDQLERLDIRDTDYENLTTTPKDVLTMLQTIADPSFTSDKLSQEMLAAMTDTYLEKRIPAGLPKDVRIAHKVGSYYDEAIGGSFGDAGIVFAPDDEEIEYFVVILSDEAVEEDTTEAMREMSREIYATFSKGSQATEPKTPG
jgi:beta-lactamase class A